MQSDRENDKLLQIRDIILGSEVKNVAKNLESSSQNLSKEIESLKASFSKDVQKMNSRIEDEKLLLINSIDFLKNEIEQLKKKLADEVSKNQKLIEKNRQAAVSRTGFSQILEKMAGVMKSEESRFEEPGQSNPEL